MPPVSTYKWYEPGVNPGGNFAVNPVELDDVTVKVIASNWTSSEWPPSGDKFVPTTVSTLFAAFGFALVRVGGAAIAGKDDPMRAIKGKESFPNSFI